MSRQPIGRGLPPSFGAVLVAALLFGTTSAGWAQTAPTEAAVRDFLENSRVTILYDGEAELRIYADTMEFVPAPHLVPGGGLLVTLELLSAVIFGMPYEPMQWWVGDTDGVLTLRLVHPEGLTLESPLVRFDGERLPVELRLGLGEGIDTDEPEEALEIEEMEPVRGSFTTLDRLGPDARRRQAEAITGVWALERIDELPVEGSGVPGVTYSFAADGTFEVAVDGEGVVDAAGIPLSGHWLTTATMWTRPPLEGHLEQGPLLLLFGEAPAPGVFMILEQCPDALVMRNQKPLPVADGLAWVTLRLRRLR
jgi:hypothetical protein